MILSDRTIREELAARRIVIDPLDDSCIQPSSVDLRLDRLFRVFLNHTMPVIDVKEDLEDLTRLIEIDEGDAFILHPGEFVLGSGRRVRVTASHNVFTVGRRGELAKVRTGELRAGVRVATPRTIPEPPRRYGRTTNAPEIAIVELVPDPAPRQLTVAGPTVVAAHGSRPEEVAGLLRGEGYAAASHYRRRCSLPYAVAQQVPGLLASLGPRDLVGWRGGRNAMPARIAIDSERAWLLGLYVARGYRRGGRRGGLEKKKQKPPLFPGPPGGGWVALS